MSVYYVVRQKINSDIKIAPPVAARRCTEQVNVGLYFVFLEVNTQKTDVPMKLRGPLSGWKVKRAQIFIDPAEIPSTNFRTPSP